MNLQSKCHLCNSREPKLIHETKKKKYYQCDNCLLVFLPEEYHVDSIREKQRYECHCNLDENEGYVNHLNRLVMPIAPMLKKKSKGLDFGCGPGPTLSKLMTALGHHVENYDPIFKDDKDLLSKSYDFVLSSEVVEHFCDAESSWMKLVSLVEQNGLLGIMTEVKTDDVEFGEWWYIRDVTHVSFYTTETFLWICSRFNLELLYSNKNVLIFRKI
jgi:2-polyprenyl-3-methyl-5-hydroxy-6-metoxy-1,4-benzoquinol methylase